MDEEELMEYEAEIIDDDLGSYFLGGRQCVCRAEEWRRGGEGGALPQGADDDGGGGLSTNPPHAPDDDAPEVAKSKL